MPDLQSSESSSQAGGSTPPPLPQKVRLFKFGWMLGFWFGVVQLTWVLPKLVLYHFAPFGMLVTVSGAALGVVSAYLISKHLTGARGLFTIATICVSISYLTAGYIVFAFLNLVPLLLLVASSSPDAVPKTQEGNPLEAPGGVSSAGSAPTKEDLY